jgi:hypothetical protein
LQKVFAAAGVDGLLHIFGIRVKDLISIVTLEISSTAQSPELLPRVEYRGTLRFASRLLIISEIMRKKYNRDANTAAHKGVVSTVRK